MKNDRRINSGLRFFGGAMLLLLAAGCWMAPGATAGELGDNLHVHGFVSQGYLNTSKNEYLFSRSNNGSAAMTEAAITLSARPLDRLRVGIQFLGRNFGVTGHDQVHIDWAYGDYRWKDQLGFRAGKVRLPYGLYNEGRDVDMLRTSIFLPQSLYNEKQRDFILAYEGAGLYGNLDMGGLGELEYHFYAGTLNVPDARTGFWADIFANVGQELEPDAGLVADGVSNNSPGTSEARFRTLEDPQITFPWIYGGSLFWTTPLEGLRFGSTALESRYNIRTVLHYDVYIPDDPGNNNPGYYPLDIDIDETARIDHIATLSTEYIHNDLTLAAEVHNDRIDGHTSRGWYGSAGYRFSDLLSLAGYYSEAEPIGGDEEKSIFKRAGLPDYYGWQKDLTISTRFDLTEFWLIKLEYHFIDGVALTQPRSLKDNLANPMDRHWGMFAIKTTFHF